MKPNYDALFSNKIIKPGEYMAQVTLVCEVDVDGPEKAIYVEVVIDNNESDDDGTMLVAVLHPTAKAKKFTDGFLESYRVTRDTLEQAEGRWAAIYVYDALYKGSAFSNVKFHPQTAYQRDRAAELEAIKKPKGSGQATLDFGSKDGDAITTKLDALSDMLDSLGA
ncbi:MAG: hypothetical protein U0640_07785 [Phycisphaerales bacterium]